MRGRLPLFPAGRSRARSGTMGRCLFFVRRREDLCCCSLMATKQQRWEPGQLWGRGPLPRPGVCSGAAVCVSGPLRVGSGTSLSRASPLLFARRTRCWHGLQTWIHGRKVGELETNKIGNSMATLSVESGLKYIELTVQISKTSRRFKKEMNFCFGDPRGSYTVHKNSQ